MYYVMPVITTLMKFWFDFKATSTPCLLNYVTGPLKLIAWFYVRLSQRAYRSITLAALKKRVSRFGAKLHNQLQRQ
jgi:hypothetical protein